MKRFVSTVALALAAVLPATPAVAQDPITVSTHVTFDPVSPGSFQDADCLVENNTAEPLLVRIAPYVTYADGDVQDFRLNFAPTVIDPNGAFLLSIGFAVPSYAAAGTATFTCDVRVLGFPGGFVGTSSSTFQVV